MRRRDKAGGKAEKTQRTKTLRRRNAPNSVAPDEVTDVARLTRERDEAREQQTATAEILRVIRASPTDVQPVFDMIAESASTLCAAQFCFVYRFDGQLLHFVAHHSVSPKAVEINRRAFPQPPSRQSVAARAILEQSVVQISDVNADPDYALGELAAVCGYRSGIGIPILRDGVPVGSIAIARAEAGLFSNRQVELLKTFADQAVIAIENVRLFNETRQALEQQTATSEVLSTISSSAGELQPVFETMLAKATELCEASYGTMWLCENNAFRAGAIHGALPEAFLQLHRTGTLYRAGPGAPAYEALINRQTCAVVDLRETRGYREGSELPVAAADIGGVRTMVAVPMFKEDEPIGVISIYRREVRPFSDKQIDLVSNFAKQAVIAIENTRLLNELRQRTDDLSESLEQQTATADVLKVISSSPGELEPVFKAMLENATRICDASYGVMFLCEGKGFRTAAMHNLPRAFAEERQRAALIEPIPIDPLARLAKTKKRVHIFDARTEAAYKRRFAPFVAAVEDGGVRTLLLTPLLREGELIGAFAIFRQEVRPFTGKQIELVDNFAAQAVIAIENTRLLNELRESLQQQTATSEVLKIISSSPGELEPVFRTMLENATNLCGAKFGNMYLRRGDAFELAATHNTPPDFAHERKYAPYRPDRGKSPTNQMVRTKSVVHVADLRSHESYLSRDPRAVAGVELGGIRALVLVPMLNEGVVVGNFAIYRQEVRPFTDKQIELVKNFAAQAVIAIENARLLSELRQSLQQQTATADVLKVISSSPGELEPVFKAMLESALRICEAEFGMLMLHHSDGSFDTRVMVGAPPALVDALLHRSFTPPPGNPLDRMLRTKKTVHVVDAAAEKAKPLSAQLAGARSHISVPMVKHNEVVGAIAIYHTEVRPFTDKQIELVTNFAAQAVIAIENARLLSELRESLQQQTATADVLKVISRSTFDLQRVLNTLTESAARLCEADKGAIMMRDGDVYRIRANYGFSDEAVQWALNNPLQPGRGSATGRAALEGRAINIPDALADPEYRAAGYHKAFGYRSMLAIPLLREGTAIGTFTLTRDEVNPFTEKQKELATTFADQAVIAIENVRLFDEVQARTRELTESLQQQTATADVLKVISRSAFDLRPVLDTLVESAARLCDADRAIIFKRDRAVYRLAAGYNTPREFEEFTSQNPIVAGRGTITGRAVLEGKTVHIPDVLADPEYTGTGYQTRGEYRSSLAVPLLREGETIGVFTLMRLAVRPYTEKQIELVTTFADQAVIAIENVRLFEEVQARTNELAQSVKELRALGEVTQSVNSSVDLETVLTTIVAKATQLSNTEAGAIYVFEEAHQEFRLRATYGMDERIIAEIRDRHMHIGETAVGKAAEQRKPVQIADLQNDPASPVLDVIVRAGFRALLVVPLLGADRIVGALVVRRKQPGEFSKSTVALLQTFAAQSVLAIQNARLFESVEARTRELAASLEDLRTTQDRLVQTQKLASLGQLTAGIAHEIKNPLNFVNNFSGVSAELIDELQEAFKDVSLNEKRRSEITELMDTLRRNLDKVMQHGKRADAIVKNMLLHSREGSGEHRSVDINALVEESLNLAYHGARAEKQGFNIRLERPFDPAAGEADVFPQDITRVLLNLISNGFYAATKRKTEANGGDYEPTLTAATKNLGDRVEIRIRDNGTGIPPDVKEKIFNPFFTTKPAGEGTGLGLSISHDIIVKQHGGSIEVDTQPGEFTEIRVILPRAAVFITESGRRA